MGVTYLANKIAGEDRFSTSATILSMGDIRSMFGGGDSGKGSKDGFMANLESHVQQDEGILSIGLLGKNAGSLQSGGGNIDLSYSSVKQVAGDLRAVSFQVSNLMDGDQGRARLTYVNTGVLSGNEDAHDTAMDIFNGDKTLKFDIKEKGHGGNADWDGETIHLNWEAANLKDGKLSNDQLGKYTSIMAKEGYILDYNDENGNTKEYEEKAIAQGGEVAAEVYKDRFNREQESYQVTEGVLNDLEKNLGIKTEGDFKKNVSLAAQGKFEEAGFSWDTGQDNRAVYAIGKKILGPTDVGDDTNPKVIYNGITKNKLDNFKKLHNIDISEKDFYLLTNLLGGRGVDAASTINNLNAFDKDGIQQVKNLIDGYKEDLRKNGIDPEKLFNEEGDNENKVDLTSILDKLAGKYQKGVSQKLGVNERYWKDKTKKDMDSEAKRLGYSKTNEYSHGQPIYKYKNTYITPDIDSHIGGTWKVANSVSNLKSKATRKGTYDKDLKNKIGD